MLRKWDSGFPQVLRKKSNKYKEIPLQSNYDFLYFITSLQSVFDLIPMNRKLIPIEGDMFKRNMYISYLKKNKEKAAPFLAWADSRLSKYSAK